MRDQPVEESGVHATLRILRRRLLVLLACLIAVPAAALLLALNQDKEYSASASLFFRTPSLNASPQGDLVPAPDPDRLAATNLTLATLRPIAARTARALGGGVTTTAVSDNVTVESDGQSDVAKVTATDPNPNQAARLANTYATQYIAFRREQDQATVDRQRRPLEREYAGLSEKAKRSPRGRDLKKRIDDLVSLRDAQTGNAEVVQSATPPDSPSSPKPARDTIVGAVVGLLLGLAIAFLWDLLDRRMRDQSEIEALFGEPLLGLIPESRGLRTQWRTPPTPEPSDLEAFRMVHVGLHYSDRIGQVRSLMVTSAASGEGKSTIAWHLACAAGSSGMRVLLIEADLRHGGTGTVLAGNRDKGLSFVLFGQDLAENTISGSEIGDESVVPPGLTLLPSGPQPPNTVKALASDRMREVIATGERDYDLVVLDTPPLATVSDAVPLLKEVDGVIPVARLGTTMRDGATALRRMLTELDAPVVGIVVNGTSALAGYGYSYGAQRDAAVDWSAIERSARERAAQRPPEDEEVGRTAGANGRPVAAEVPPEPILADASAPAPTPANHAEPRVTATVTHADAPSTAPRRGRRSTLRARLAALARGR